MHTIPPMLPCHLAWFAGMVVLALTAVEDEARSSEWLFGALHPAVDGMLRTEAVDHFHLADFTYAPHASDRRALLRVRPSVAFTAHDRLKFYIEGQAYGSVNHEDYARVSLYQGYVEGHVSAVVPVTYTAGRQELTYGSTFMLGTDTFFDGLSFDAVKVAIQPRENIRVDLFGGRYAPENAGGIKGELYGVYGTYTPSERFGLDLYGMLDTGGPGLTHRDGNHERTYAVGARAMATFGRWLGLEAEPVYQFGCKRTEGGSVHSDIEAYAGHVDVTIDPAIGHYAGVIFLSYAFGSGDGDPGNNRFREFHNPDNNTALVGDMHVIGDLSGLHVTNPTTGVETVASGLHVLVAGTGVDVTDQINVSLDAHSFHAVKTPAGVSTDIGIESNLVVTYKITPQLSVLASVNRFFTAGFFKDAAGSDRDINYGYVQLQATY